MCVLPLIFPDRTGQDRTWPRFWTAASISSSYQPHEWMRSPRRAGERRARVGEGVEGSDTAFVRLKALISNNHNSLGAHPMPGIALYFIAIPPREVSSPHFTGDETEAWKGGC